MIEGCIRFSIMALSTFQCRRQNSQGSNLIAVNYWLTFWFLPQCHENFTQENRPQYLHFYLVISTQNRQDNHMKCFTRMALAYNCTLVKNMDLLESAFLLFLFVEQIRYCQTYHACLLPLHL